MTSFHIEKKVNMLIPKYVLKFKCIGVQCTDTCCKGWNVGVDKKTYTLYKNVKSQELKQEIRDYLHRNRKVIDKKNYAHIEMQGEEKQCPFLQNSLCKIQKIEGAAYLSNTCATFPRLTTNIADTVEQSLSLACPEAARLALSTPDAMDLIEATLPIRPEVIESNTHGKLQNTTTPVYARAAVMKILASDNYSPEHLLLIVSAFIESLHLAKNSITQEKLEGMVYDLLKELNNQSIPTPPRALKFHTFQIQTFLELFKLKRNINKSRFLSPVLNYANRDKSLIESYSAGLNIINQKHGTVNAILKNYCIHEVYQKKFPHLTPFDPITLGSIIVNFYIIKTVLAITIGAQHVSNPQETSIIAIKNFTKEYQHDTLLKEAVDELIKSMGFGTLESAKNLLIN